MNVDTHSREHFVYRMYGYDSQLLYIGATVSVKARLQVHGSLTPWFNEVACVTSVAFPDRRSAFDEEAAAIRDEQPLYNVRSKGSAVPTERAA